MKDFLPVVLMVVGIVALAHMVAHPGLGIIPAAIGGLCIGVSISMIQNR